MIRKGRKALEVMLDTRDWGLVLGLAEGDIDVGSAGLVSSSADEGGGARSEVMSMGSPLFLSWLFGIGKCLD